MSDDSQALIGKASGYFREEMELWKRSAAAILAAMEPEPDLDTLDQALAAMTPEQRVRLSRACILVGRQARNAGLT